MLKVKLSVGCLAHLSYARCLLRHFVSPVSKNELSHDACLWFVMLLSLIVFFLEFVSLEARKRLGDSVPLEIQSPHTSNCVQISPDSALF